MLSELDSLFDDAAAGRGALVLIAGEAGIGKTSVARRFAEQVADRGVVLWGACDALMTPRPLSPLLDIAADPDSQIADLLAAVSEPYEIYAGFLDRLKGTMRPTLVVIEDVHWADEATFDLLRFLARRIGASNALLLVTYRDDEIGPEHPLRLVIGDVASAGTIHRMGPAPLSVEAVGRLSEGHDVDAAKLHTITGGNAFFVTEALATDQMVPTSVRDAVLARVLRLPSSARNVAEGVSISPGALEVRLARTLTGSGADAVDECTRSGVLVSDGEVLRFRHELARVAVEDDLNAVRRLELHRRMIGLLLEHDPPDPARITHHADQAGSGDLVHEFAPAAAREAAQRGSHREAVRFYERALSYPDDIDQDGYFELTLDYSFALSSVDRQVDAVTEAAKAVEHYRQGGPSRELGRALITYARPNIDVQHRQSALEEAIAILEDVGDDELLAEALSVLAIDTMLRREYAPARELADRDLELTQRIGTPYALVRGLIASGAPELVTGDEQLGFERLEEALAVAREANNQYLLSYCLSMLGSGGGEVRHYDRALRWIDEGIALSASHDADMAIAYELAWKARILCEQGKWDEAVSVAEEVGLDRPGGTPITPITASGAVGRVGVRRGTPGSRQLLEGALERAGDVWLQHRWALHAALAEYHWLNGSMEQAAAEVAGPYEEALATDSPWARGEMGFWMWMAGAIDGPPEGAAPPFALHMSGEWREAAAAWQEIGCPYEEALALSHGDAESMLAALHTFDGLGALPAAQWLRQRMREAGVESIPRGPRSATVANPAGLTGRQLEVLQLMAQGLSNAEIAQKLFISKRTVEHHVSAIMAKLDASTRAKAVAVAVEMGAIDK